MGSMKSIGAMSRLDIITVVWALIALCPVMMSVRSRPSL